MCLLVFCSAFSPACFVEKPILPAGNCLNSVLKAQLAVFLWLFSGSLFFRRTTCLFSYRWPAILPPAAFQSLEIRQRVGDTSVPVAAVPASTLFAFLCELQNHFLSLYRIAVWDFYCAGIDSTDQMRKGRHFKSIEPFNP